jgi:hypothetical protein
MKPGDKEKKAIQDSEDFWELEGESDLNVATIPAPPVAGKPTIIRLTHSNSYGPFEQVEFYVRIGNLDKPTGPEDLDSASDWVQAELVEELVDVDGEEQLRSEVEESDEETPWWGTYDAELVLPAGPQLIEIKIVSQEPELMSSVVLADWEVEVREA